MLPRLCLNHMCPRDGAVVIAAFNLIVYLTMLISALVLFNPDLVNAREWAYRNSDYGDHPGDFSVMTTKMTYGTGFAAMLINIYANIALIIAAYRRMTVVLVAWMVIQVVAIHVLGISFVVNVFDFLGTQWQWARMVFTILHILLTGYGLVVVYSYYVQLNSEAALYQYQAPKVERFVNQENQPPGPDPQQPLSVNFHPLTTLPSTSPPPYGN